MADWLLEPAVGLTYAVAVVVFVALSVIGLRRGWRHPWLTAFVAGTLASLLFSLPGWVGDPGDANGYVGSLMTTVSVFGLPLAAGAATGALLFRRSSIVVRVAVASVALLLSVPIAPFVGLIAVCSLTNNCP